MKTPIETLLAVDVAGGKLGFAGDKLRMLLPADCLPELKDAIRQHKPGLVSLLRLNFLVVRSDTLERTYVLGIGLGAVGESPGVRHYVRVGEKRKGPLKDLAGAGELVGLQLAQPVFDGGNGLVIVLT